MGTMTMEKTFKRDFSSLDPIFRFVTKITSSERANERTDFCVKLAVEELFTNMVKYNSKSATDITIRAASQGGSLVVELIDSDVDPFDPATADEAGVDEALADRRIGGLGLRLVRSVVDRITYEYKNRTMTVTVTKQLER
jgi:anti-sigma regulatory factor (Ser/Thr protein kinase)